MDPCRPRNTINCSKSDKPALLATCIYIDLNTLGVVKRPEQARLASSLSEA